MGYLKWISYTGENSVKRFCLFYQQLSTLKEKNLLLEGAVCTRSNKVAGQN